MAADGVQSLARKQAVLTEPALEAARYGLARAWPMRSAHQRLTRAQAMILVLLAILAVAAGIWRPAWLAASLHIGLFAIFAACAALRLASSLMLLKPPRRAPRRWHGPLPVYTLLCPMFREAGQVPRLLAALGQLDYPHDLLDVKLLVEADDSETIQAIQAMTMPPWVECLVLENCAPRTKPKALNAGLGRARGRFLTVYDAEDHPHPGQLREALDAFASGGADLACVQAPLLIDNAASSWISGQFALEYAVQFLGQGALLSRLRLPFPLGGSSNHFRTEALRASGGWDAFNVTEDADVGFRLARDGWRFGTLHAPTFEEAPVKLGAWLRQRSRWIKGHLQTWLVLMRDPYGALRELGLWGFAAMQIALGGAVLSALLGAPTIGLLLAYAVVFPHKLGMMDIGLALFALFSAGCVSLLASARLRQARLAFALLSQPLYWCLGFPAACLALYELVLRPFYWAKTAHGQAKRENGFAPDMPGHQPFARADHAE
jgi:glycosyltransferase XagB